MVVGNAAGHACCRLCMGYVVRQDCGRELPLDRVTSSAHTTSCHHESKITVGSCSFENKYLYKKAYSHHKCDSADVLLHPYMHSLFLWIQHHRHSYHWAFSSVAAFSSTHTVSSYMYTHIHNIYTEWIELLFLSSWNNNINEVHVFTYIHAHTRIVTQSLQP